MGVLFVFINFFLSSLIFSDLQRQKWDSFVSLSLLACVCPFFHVIANQVIIQPRQRKKFKSCIILLENLSSNYLWLKSTNIVSCIYLALLGILVYKIEFNDKEIIIFYSVLLIEKVFIYYLMPMRSCFLIFWLNADFKQYWMRTNHIRRYNVRSFRKMLGCSSMYTSVL